MIGVEHAFHGGLPRIESAAPLFEGLVAEFGGQDVYTASPPSLRRSDIDIPDPVADYLAEQGLAIDDTGNGRRIPVECPQAHLHSSDNGPSQTVWLVAGTGGHEEGRFDCRHTSHGKITTSQFLAYIGYVDGRDDLAALADNDTPASRLPRFEFVSSSEFVRRPSPKWWIKSVLPEAGLGMIYGASGAGKSFFALDLAATIALGEPWRGRKVRQGRVAYVCAEGVSGFIGRIKAHERHYAVSFGDQLVILPEQPSLLAALDTSSLIEAVRRSGASIVFIDTLAQVTPGGDENSAVDMGKAIKACRQIYEATGAMVVLIHHAGKDASRGARGWSGIRAAVDVEYEVSRSGDARVAKITKMKEGEEGAAFGFRLLPVVLGYDEDGDEITSCVVAPAEAAPPGQRAPTGRWQKAVWDAFHDAVGLADEGVAEADLVAQAIASEPTPTEGQDRRKERVKRAIKEMVEKGVFVRLADRIVLT